MRIIRFVFVILILVLGWLIGWNNNTPVNFSFLVWQLPEMPVFIFYFLFLLGGVVLGLLLGRFARRK